VQKPGGIGSDNAFYDPLAFKPVTDVRFGNTGRNILRGPGLVNVNTSVFRKFPVKERYAFEVRAEALNASNTPHFANPGGTNVSNLRFNPDGSIRALGGFMAITSTLGTVTGDERQFRFALRLTF